MKLNVYAPLLALAMFGMMLTGCSSPPQMESDVQLKADAVARRAPDVRLVGAIVAGDYRRNMVISPYGLRRLFGMLVLGARGRTHDQIVEALGVTDEADATPPRLPGFRVRDGMWIEGGFTMQPSYEAEIRTRFDADVFHNVALRAMERWVSVSTGGQVPSIPLPPDTTFVAIDALTYHVKWAQPFEVGNTKPGPFHAADGGRRSR